MLNLSHRAGDASNPFNLSRFSSNFGDSFYRSGDVSITKVSVFLHSGDCCFSFYLYRNLNLNPRRMSRVSKFLICSISSVFLVTDAFLGCRASIPDRIGRGASLSSIANFLFISETEGKRS